MQSCVHDLGPEQEEIAPSLSPHWEELMSLNVQLENTLTIAKKRLQRSLHWLDEHQRDSKQFFFTRYFLPSTASQYLEKSAQYTCISFSPPGVIIATITNVVWGFRQSRCTAAATSLWAEVMKKQKRVLQV